MDHSSLSERLLADLGFSVTELAALRGVSRQYAARDLSKFVSDADGLNALCRTLLAIGTDSSRATAERLKKFAAEQLGIYLTVGSAISLAGSKTATQLFAEHRELWIWSSSPFDVETVGYWEKLCTEFLDQEDRLLVYFVPTVEIADRLAERFETKLYGRQYDEDGVLRQSAKGFRSTIFIIVTNLAASIPYTMIGNPGTIGTHKEGLPPSGWVMGKQGQDFFELSRRYVDQLAQVVRSAGLGEGRSVDNFFPLGQALNKSGMPFENYRDIDQLIGIRLDRSLGMFDGEPKNVSSRQVKEDESNGKREPNHNDGTSSATDHQLKFYPVFIRAYRKKSGELSKRKAPKNGGRLFFNF